MEQELKELLIKDLCARLPYGIKVKRPDCSYYDYVSAIDIDAGTLTCQYNGYTEDIEKFIPYLRPMSSMTEEERNERLEIITTVYNGEVVDDEFVNVIKYIDWLNAHHFDFHNLIGSGLALEAPNGMYNLEKD